MLGVFHQIDAFDTVTYLRNQSWNADYRQFFNLRLKLLVTECPDLIDYSLRIIKSGTECIESILAADFVKFLAKILRILTGEVEKDVLYLLHLGYDSLLVLDNHVTDGRIDWDIRRIHSAVQLP